MHTPRLDVSKRTEAHTTVRTPQPLMAASDYGAPAQPRRSSRDGILWRAGTALLQFLRRGAVCDRCNSSMVEAWRTGMEHVCVRCVMADYAAVVQQLSQYALGAAELAGASAAMRALLLELHGVARQRMNPEDQARIASTVAVVDCVLWWMTPEELRVPSFASIDESAMLLKFAEYDKHWGFRVATKPLRATYMCWRGSAETVSRR